MTTNPARVAVVIPYYQREPGILRRTIRAVVGQQDAGFMDIIVVDDGSPMPAEPELAEFANVDTVRIRLLKQANGGPARARNHGLDAIAPDTEYVALLDSDDIWHEHHIKHAVAALDLGYDFYFADHRRDQTADSHFKICKLSASTHTVVDKDRHLYAYTADFLTEIIRHCPVGTSTAVMRRKPFEGIRFDEDLSSHDDLLFWTDIARKSSRIAFSNSIQVKYGIGINIYAALRWTSPENLYSCLDFLKLYAKMKNNYSLSMRQTALINEKIRNTNNDFVRTNLALLRRRQLPDRNVVRSFMSNNIGVYQEFVRVILAETANRIVGRFLPQWH